MDFRRRSLLGEAEQLFAGEEYRVGEGLAGRTGSPEDGCHVREQSVQGLASNFASTSRQYRVKSYW